MTIRNPTVQTVVASIVFIISLVLFMKMFGVFQDDMTLREQLRAAPIATLVSLALAACMYGATIFLTNLNAKQREDLEIKLSTGDDFAAIQKAESELKKLISSLGKSSGVYRVSLEVIELVKLSCAYISEELGPEDMPSTHKLRLLYDDFCQAVRDHIADLGIQRYDPEASQRILESDIRFTKLLSGFAEFMIEVKPSGSGQAIKNLELKLRAWGYLGELQTILKNQEKGE